MNQVKEQYSDDIAGSVIVLWALATLVAGYFSVQSLWWLVPLFIVLNGLSKMVGFIEDEGAVITFGQKIIALLCTYVLWGLPFYIHGVFVFDWSWQVWLGNILVWIVTTTIVLVWAGHNE